MLLLRGQGPKRPNTGEGKAAVVEQLQRGLHARERDAGKQRR